MKGREPHVVFLSPPALAILEKVRCVGGIYAFPSPLDPRGRLSSLAMLEALKRMSHQKCYHLGIRNTAEGTMSTTVTSKGQVTIPKHIRDALRLRPGSIVDFAVDGQGQVVIVPVKTVPSRKAKDRFESVRGSATVKWRTEDLMRLLRDGA